MTEELTYDQIAERLLNTDLGRLADGNTVSGTIASYVNGLMQGLYNIAQQGDTLSYAVEHLNDAEKDVWELGHDAAIALYLGLKTELS